MTLVADKRFPCFDRPWTERCPCGDDPSLGEGCPLSKPKTLVAEYEAEHGEITDEEIAELPWRE